MNIRKSWVNRYSKHIRDWWKAINEAEFEGKPYDFKGLEYPDRGEFSIIPEEYRDTEFKVNEHLQFFDAYLIHDGWHCPNCDEDIWYCGDIRKQIKLGRCHNCNQKLDILGFVRSLPLSDYFWIRKPARKAFDDEGIVTLGDLADTQPKHLLMLLGIGKVTLRDLYKSIQESYGILDHWDIEGII